MLLFMYCVNDQSYHTFKSVERVFNSAALTLSWQGYHDIVSVLMLTLNEEQERTGSQTDQELTTTLNLMVEKLSLHRLRDSMGPGLEPLVGLLRSVILTP